MFRATIFIGAIAASLIAVAPAASAKPMHHHRHHHWSRYDDGWRHHSLGGPARVGDRCWVSTDPLGHGFYQRCPDAPKRKHHRHHHRHMHHG